MNVIRALLMKDRFELNVAVGAEAQHGTVGGTADKRKANEHSKKLFAHIFSDHIHNHGLDYTISSRTMQVLCLRFDPITCSGACAAIAAGLALSG